MLELSVQRNGKPYSIELANEHPFIALQIAKSGINSIVQKNFGDCWFDAALAAVAINPSRQNLIAGMIRQASPNLYYVSFADEPHIYWPIQLSTIRRYDLENKVLWASLLEQACLIRFRNGHDGGQIEWAMKMLTGQDSGHAITQGSLLPQGMKEGTQGKELSINQMADIINAALLNHQPVAIGTKSRLGLRMEEMAIAWKQAGVKLDASGKPIDPNFERNAKAGKYNSLLHMSITQNLPPLILWGNHAYTVIAFDPVTNMITLRNPFGTDDLNDPQAQSADWAGEIDMDKRKRLVQDLGGGYVKLNLNALYPYIRKLVWGKF